MSSLPVLAILLAAAAAEPAPQINPVPRATLSEIAVAAWTFEKDAAGWAAQHDCTLAAEEGLLKIRSTGEDPYFHRPLKTPGGEMLLKIKARSRTAGVGQVFWTTDQSPARDPKKSTTFPLTHDGQWHDFAAKFTAVGDLRDLRIDPGAVPGEFEIQRIELVRCPLHPLSIDRVDVSDTTARFTVKNHGTQPIEFTAFGQRHTAAAGESIAIERTLARTKPLEAVTIELTAEALPPVTRTVYAFHPDVAADWIARPLGDCTLEVARDGSAARVRSGRQVVAAMAPLVLCEGKVPSLRLVEEAPSLRFEGDGVRLTLSTSGKEIGIAIASERQCDSPAVRVLGTLEGGILAGVEYLGRGDTSSSRLDIENDRHLRFAPDPLDVTLPLMSLVTDRAAAALTWTDMSLQPFYASPNFFDGTPDHRMALRGTKIEATLLVDRLPVEETILWAVRKHGLPALPKPPRTRDEQWALCLAAMNGPLKTEAGWGHCAEDHWPRHPFADMASTIWKISGKIPDVPKLVPGGSHVPNGSIYFVTGRAQQWLDHQKQAVAGLIRQQQPDGSYRYGGEFRRGHFEDTANGVCARPAAQLLEFAHITGDQAALAAGLKTLDYMKRFDVPRGAQVWEIPLHTPDQLASAYAVWAYVRGFELTGKREYLTEARRWALSGVPFTYLWSRYPIMLYGTPPVLGATNWQAPVWIGLPVQWVGGVYAYALAMLAPHDQTLDWLHLARGILISAEQQQYPDGPWIGLLPDSVELRSQERRPWRISPAAIVGLRLVLDGDVDFLAVASDGRRRIAAPFPVTLRDNKARLRAQLGLKYQVLVDGKPVEIVSQGDDVLALD